MSVVAWAERAKHVLLPWTEKDSGGIGWGSGGFHCRSGVVGVFIAVVTLTVLLLNVSHVAKWIAVGLPSVSGVYVLRGLVQSSTRDAQVLATLCVGCMSIIALVVGVEFLAGMGPHDEGEGTALDLFPAVGLIMSVCGVVLQGFGLFSRVFVDPKSSFPFQRERAALEYTRLRLKPWGPRSVRYPGFIPPELLVAAVLVGLTVAFVVIFTWVMVDMFVMFVQLFGSEFGAPKKYIDTIVLVYKATRILFIGGVAFSFSWSVYQMLQQYLHDLSVLGRTGHLPSGSKVTPKIQKRLLPHVGALVPAYAMVGSFVSSLVLFIIVFVFICPMVIIAYFVDSVQTWLLHTMIYTVISVLLHHAVKLVFRWWLYGEDSYNMVSRPQWYELVYYVELITGLVIEGPLSAGAFVGMFFGHLLSFFRVDKPSFPRGLEFWDGGFRAYSSLLLAENVINNPIARTARGLFLQRDPGYGHGRRARTRWFLAVTLINNPSLKRLRRRRKHDEWHSTSSMSGDEDLGVGVGDAAESALGGDLGTDGSETEVNVPLLDFSRR